MKKNKKENKMVEGIVQEDEMGCAIACVAFAINGSYKYAKELFTHPEYALKRGYYCRAITHVLGKQGLDYSFRKVTYQNKHLVGIEGAIVFIGKNEKYPNGHFLINTSEGWMDSWMNFPARPRDSGFRKVLPGNAEWVIYPKP